MFGHFGARLIMAQAKEYYRDIQERIAKTEGQIQTIANHSGMEETAAMCLTNFLQGKIAAYNDILAEARKRIPGVENDS